jgi:hypothetical protein
MKVKNILVSQNAPTEFEKSPYAELKKNTALILISINFSRLMGSPLANLEMPKLIFLNMMLYFLPAGMPLITFST